MCLHCLIGETIASEARARGLRQPLASEAMAALAAAVADVLVSLPPERRETRLAAFVAGVRERAVFLSHSEAAGRALSPLEVN